ncbi:hypothetical protein [Phenylobacterium sp. J367]|uniref:hypothetical protein n=1 Tax=Phenylobacterium sp. J367 TaxID=2898435 RepID=UPI002151F112|nr:hypothetical protein [Phenylobacterium sp. J367]MCR5881271.1 hypothetical protein [Phenylobacterium sp. J367]
MTLLSRDPRHVVLTEEGEMFLPQARRLLRVNDEILAEVRGDDIEGEVRLGAPRILRRFTCPTSSGNSRGFIRRWR